MEQRKNRKIVKVRRRRHFSFALLLALFICVYVIIISVNYFNKKRITIYEVTQTSIASDNRCTGVIIREEKLQKSTSAGYINYYTAASERVAKDEVVYSIDESGNIYEILASNAVKFVNIGRFSPEKGHMRLLEAFDRIHKENPDTYHGISRFDPDTGVAPSGGESFSSRFGQALCDLAEKDKRRRVNYQHYTGRTWGMSQNYDISLDTGVLGIDQCVDIVCGIVENSRK